jgi:hypothetical protein
MYPNSALAAWQLALMISVPVMAMAVWLGAVFLAARQRSDHAHEASTAPDVAAGDDQEWQDRLAALAR